MKKVTMVVLVVMAGWLSSEAHPDQSLQHKQNQITVRGCVSRSSGDFVLMQLDPGNSYVMHSTNKIKLEDHLGEEVTVIGTESPTLSDTSDTGRSASSTTVVVTSISTISKECRM